MILLLALGPSIGLASTLTVGSTGSYSTIQSAIDVASPGDVISITSGTYNECLTLSTSNVSIEGQGAVTIDGSNCSSDAISIPAGSGISFSNLVAQNSSGRVFSVESAIVEFDGVTISDSGTSSTNGPAIYIDGGTVSLTGATIENNEGSYGGAIRIASGNLTISNCYFSGNEGLNGAVIYADYSSSIVSTNNTFTNNSTRTGGFGGAITIRYSSSLTDTGSSFTSNTSEGKAGAIYVEQGQSNSGTSELLLDGTVFTDNQSDNTGGAIYAKDASTIEVVNASFSANYATKGGAVFFNGIAAEAIFTNTEFSLNSTNTQTSGGEGGAITALANGSAKPSGLILTNVSFVENSAKTYGGAVVVGGPYNNNQHGNLIISNSTFSSNSSYSSQSSAGGAIYVNTDPTNEVSIYQTLFSSNSSEISGGALYIAATGDVSITLSRFIDNLATGQSNVYDKYGGAVLIDSSTNVTISNSLFGGNLAQSSSVDGFGGAIAVEEVEMVNIYNSIFAENHSSTNGGAWYFFSVTDSLLLNNTFLGNESTAGGAGYFSSATGELINNIFAYSVGSTIYSGSSISASYNDWYQNSTTDSGGASGFSTSSNGNLTVDPDLQAYSQDGDFTNDNWNIASTSALVDAGDANYLDLDFSRSDIGAYGGSGLLDNDADGVGGLSDCDDSDPAAYPGVASNDSSLLCMRDSDSDGYGDSSPANGNVTAGTDCDDSNPLISPAATEVCDGVDNDCSGVIDDNAVNGVTWYPDVDSDGFGDAYGGIMFCDQPTGYLSDGTDCDDLDFFTYPGSAEADSVVACMKDSDGDGYGDSTPSNTAVTAGTDCDDSDNSVSPAATETPSDGFDQNCDGAEDCFQDIDGDGYGSETVVSGFNMSCEDLGEAPVGGDCDDSSSDIFPGAAENDSTTFCMKDSDEDGYGDAYVVGSGVYGGNDCNDDDPQTYLGATEIVADEVDQDCDQSEICYVDNDGDGFGSESTVPSSDMDCSDAGEATNATDCDDSSGDINPDAEEILADGIDQDCDGEDSSSQTEPSTEEPSEPSTEEPSEPSTEEPSEPTTEEPSAGEPAGENIVPSDDVKNEGSCSTSGMFTQSGLFSFLLGWLLVGRQRRRS